MRIDYKVQRIQKKLGFNHGGTKDTEKSITLSFFIKIFSVISVTPWLSSSRPNYGQVYCTVPVFTSIVYSVLSIFR